MGAVEAIIHFFQTGGWFMYPILLVLAIGVAITIERAVKLLRVKKNNEDIWGKVYPMLEAGDFDGARDVTSSSDSAIGVLLNMGLSRQGSVRRRDDVEIAMEESMMEIIPQIEKRTPYIALFANISTLLGLLGTIMGLIDAFTAVAGADPAEKADLLSASISVAMNTTAFGLMSGILLLCLHVWVNAKTGEIVDSLEMASVKMLNIITEFTRRQSVLANQNA